MDLRKELPRKLMRGVSQRSPTKRCQRSPYHAIPASAGLGKAKEIVDAAFISGVSMARYITGHALNVKGGFYMGCVIRRGVQSSAFPRRTKSD